MRIILTFCVFFLVSTEGYAKFFPTEVILRDSNNFAETLIVGNGSNKKILYEITTIVRIPNKNNLLKTNLKDKNFPTIESSKIFVSPKRFIIDKGQYQKVKISIDPTYLKKLEEGSYLIGVKAKPAAVLKSDSEMEVPKKKKMVGATAQFIPTFLSNIIILKGKNKYANIDITKASLDKNKNLSLGIKRDSKYFGFGLFNIEYSKDGKTWEPISKFEYKLYKTTGYLKKNLSKELGNKKGFLKIKYELIKRYGTHTYDEKTIKIP